MNNLFEIKEDPVYRGKLVTILKGSALWKHDGELGGVPLFGSNSMRRFTAKHPKFNLALGRAVLLNGHSYIEVLIGNVVYWILRDRSIIVT